MKNKFLTQFFYAKIFRGSVRRRHLPLFRTGGLASGPGQSPGFFLFPPAAVPDAVCPPVRGCQTTIRMIAASENSSVAYQLPVRFSCRNSVEISEAQRMEMDWGRANVIVAGWFRITS